MKKKLPAFTFRTLINNYRQFIKMRLGMDEQTIEKGYEEYKFKQPDASVRDYMWSLFNMIILKGGNGHIYREMGRFVSIYEGKNGNRYHRIALKDEFEGYWSLAKHAETRQGIAVISDERCTHSMKYNGTHDFKDFPEGIPLANEDCSLTSCTCCYSLVPLRDENGRLIWLKKF